MSTILSYQDLLAPIDDATFRREHLGRHALALPARELPGFDALDATAFAARAPNHVDVIQEGLAAPHRDDVIPAGCSLRVRRVQLLDEPTQRFAHRLARTLREEVNVNLYLSPNAETPGLAPHTDPYDLFVLQLQGTKHWELAGDPDGRLADERLRQEGELTIGTRGELDLGPGEVLYVPRGLRHRARNVGPEPSIHLAVSILTKTMGSCIDWLAAELERRLDPSRPLPLGGSHDDYDEAIAELRTAALEILTASDRAEAFLGYRDLVEYEGLTLSVEDKRAKPRR